MNDGKITFQPKKLEEIIVAMGLLKKEDADALTKECQSLHKSLLEVMLEKGIVDEANAYKALAAQHNYDFFDLKNYDIVSELKTLLPKNLVKMQNLIPVKREGSLLTIATFDPASFFSVQSIRMITGLNVKLVVSQKSEILRIKTNILENRETVKQPEQTGGSLARRFFGIGSKPEPVKSSTVKAVNISEVIDDINVEFVSSPDESANFEDISIESKKQPIITFTNKMILEAVKKQASDIHIEKNENNCLVRFRIDGDLYDQYSIEKEAHDSVISRIKVMSGLDITEKSLPQDGSFKLRIEGSQVDFRVSIFPSVFGQNIVIRVLNRRVVPLDVAKLGFSKQELDLYQNNISRPYGMILVTGPTGSGKTTTLYSSLLSVNDGKKKIITVEDPVEFQIEGVHQTQVFINKNDPSKSLTFAQGLRSILRQDPDVIMIGEIRDAESAEIAVNASMTGHLVFSTVHANHSVEVISRIKSLGIDINFFMDSVNMVIAQRLVRKICPACRILVDDLQKEFELYKMKPIDFGGARIYKGAGCQACGYTGYAGRSGIFEMFNLSDNIKENISQNQSIFKIKKLAISEGLVTLRDCCIEKVKLGETTIEELKSISMED
ncbi:MAG: GspE/PulE family protein [Candidatus Wallbacteria bacterium]